MKKNILEQLKTTAYSVDGNLLLLFDDDLRIFSSKNGNKKKSIESLLIKQLKTYRLDTVIITTQGNSPETYTQMLVLEKNGSYSNFCGNGAKLLAYVYKDILRKNKKIAIENIHGTFIHMVLVGKNHFQIQIPVEKKKIKKTVAEMIKNIFKLENDYCFSLFTAADEPHLIVDLSQNNIPNYRDLYSSCIKIQSLFPMGVNIDLITNDNIDTIVFERGVNNFTESCGTGSVSVATFLQHRDKTINFITQQGTVNKLRVKNTEKCFPSLSGKIQAIKLFDHSLNNINLNYTNSLSISGGAI